MERTTRPPLESLTCINPECEHCGQRGMGNLIIRKVYGKDNIRYIRCNSCKEEFSERKGTAMWNLKSPEAKIISTAEQLSEGTSTKGTARLVGVGPETVRRIKKRLGKHGQGFHDEKVTRLSSTALQADERHGFVAKKNKQCWEAEVIDPKTRLIVSRAQGARDEQLIRKVMEDAASRVSYPEGVVFFSDGEASYKTLFPEVFGKAYNPPRQGTKGRMPKVRYRVGRRQAHVRIIKHRVGMKLKEVAIEIAHGTAKRVQRELGRLGYKVANTSAIERRNGTARRMDSFSVRRSLSFARTLESRDAGGWWAVTVYNWAREHRSLRRLLPEPKGRKLYEKCSPAMAAGLTNVIWSIEQLLRYQLAPPSGTG